MRTISSSSLLVILTSLVAGCATEGDSNGRGDGPGGKADGGDEAGLHVRAVTTTLAEFNVIRWPVAVDEESDVDDVINEALSFETITGEDLEAIKRDWSTGDADSVRYGIVAADFQVNGNVRSVLSLTVGVETMAAYPDFYNTYLNFNSLTGAKVEITDILDASALPGIAERLDVRLQEEIATLKTELAAEIESGEISADQWDGLHVTAEDLSSFSTTPDGITFHWDSGFPHAITALSPAGDFDVSIDELDAAISADGLWANEY